ncbi:MAG: acyclic terpene utilization AtuA family protein [Parvibaculum sp.]|uniref:acyclic terpene utilization AtuA family protein n=1 Tax=Parvibaculum sp. TaxID=2024848 RepID=UPI003C71C1FE
MSKKVIRIGGASGFWGDAAMATPQLLAAGGLDYIVYDYLAEITMSIMARARAEKPDAGFATDFVSQALKPNLAEIARQKVKIISNAGGVNPEACAAAVRALIADRGLDLKVAAITGDDLIASKDELAAQGFAEMFSADVFPDPKKILSVNAYLGAFPIAKALGEGADIVITGRSVDSAVTLGACIHEFGWTPSDLDKLAGGSLAGHILECGPQATGGNFTDWESVIDRLEDIGYPIAEVSPDGTFVCTKPEGSGGVVNVGTVSEQMLYEIGDPQAYMLPDVVCDFSQVKVEQQGADRVLVWNAKGHPAPDTYKVCATYVDGFRGGLTMSFYGMDASRKAERFAEVVYKRARRTLRGLNLPDYTEVSTEVIGAESQYGSARRIEVSREVVVKIAAKHPEAAGIGILLKEATGLGLATPPGLSGFAGGRPKPMPVARLFSFAIPKSRVAIAVEVDGRKIAMADAAGRPFDPASLARPETPQAAETANLVRVPLVSLAWARSGDKGDKANVGVIARRAEYFPYICRSLTTEIVVERFAHFLKGEVERFVLPGPHALNFLLHNVLGGGGIASLRNDPQGKGYSQLLLEVPIEVPAELARRDGLPAA